MTTTIPAENFSAGIFVRPDQTTRGQRRENNEIITLRQLRNPRS